MLNSSNSNTSSSTWNNYLNNLFICKKTGIRLDISKMSFNDSFLDSFNDKFQNALSLLSEIESGKIVNIDEKRMVGHYWLRNPALSPNKGIENDILESIEKIKGFSTSLHQGLIKGERGENFKNLLIIGIGGSALGPQLVYDALSNINDKVKLYFCDNTDPDGIERLKYELKDSLSSTLSIVISKSGGTPETRNGMIEFESFYKSNGLQFSKHAVSITCKDSVLDKYSKDSGWIDTFYMWDWVGGRTSLYSAVGLLPLSLLGVNIDEFISGARDMDESGREEDYKNNLPLLLSSMWYFATEGKGKKDMVILPYKDRLSLFSKYLQQLIMESLGKEKDLEGNIVHQGISVYGNKGSTDQHAYIQQLRDGVPNFFATFIEVLSDYSPNTTTPYTEVGNGGITSGDYLQGFFLGTREALFENSRDSITITLENITPYTLGALISLFEKAVSFYASYINVNAYHQPGVEAGKKAAEKVIEIRRKIKSLELNEEKEYSVEEIADLIKEPLMCETIYKILEHKAVNEPNKVKRSNDSHPSKLRYRFVK